MKPNRECDSYGWQKFLSAIEILTGDREPTDRLKKAIWELDFITPEKNLPVSIRDEFIEFMDYIKSKDIDALDNIERGHAVDKIITLYDTAARYQGPLDA